jgi:hypothetical protein
MDISYLVPLSLVGLLLIFPVTWWLGKEKNDK